MVKGTLVLDDCEDRLTEEDLERCHLLINTTGVELQLDTGDLLSRQGGWVVSVVPTRAGQGCVCGTQVYQPIFCPPSLCLRMAGLEKIEQSKIGRFCSLNSCTKNIEIGKS